MSSPFRAAAVQMTSGEDPDANRRAALALVERAAADGARLVALPELFVCYGRPERVLAAAESIPGPTSDALCAAARSLGITLVAGSLGERSPRADRIYNTSLLIGPDGAILARYRKRRLFDLQIAGQVSSRESSWQLPGDACCVTPTPCGRIGQAICFDLRFSELFREMVDAQCEVIVVPSAFTATTGRDHWETLLRARAIECQAYVIAPNQCGAHAPGMTSYGHSMIVDPWGAVLAVADEDEAIAAAEIDLSRVAEIRARLPMRAARNLDRGAAT